MIELEDADLALALDPAPPVLAASVVPTTLSISHMFVATFSPDFPSFPNPDPDPEPDPTTFFGVPSMTLGFGGAPPYISAYPIGGI